MKKFEVKKMVRETYCIDEKNKKTILVKELCVVSKSGDNGIKWDWINYPIITKSKDINWHGFTEMLS